MRGDVPPSFRPVDEPVPSSWRPDEVFGGLIILVIVVTVCLLILAWAGVI